MLINGVSLCISVVIIHASSSGAYTRPSARMRQFVFGYLGRLLRFQSWISVDAITPSSVARKSLPPSELLLTHLSNGSSEKPTSKESEQDELLWTIMKKIETKLDTDREVDLRKEEWLLICRILDYALFIIVSCCLSLFTAGFGIYVSILNDAY